MERAVVSVTINRIRTREKIRSLMWSKKTVGASTEPWGRSALI